MFSHFKSVQTRPQTESDVDLNKHSVGKREGHAFGWNLQGGDI